MLPKTPLILALAVLTALYSAHAQETPDSADALQKQAKRCADSGRFIEAEKTYLAATKAYEKQLTAQKPSDAVILRWCECRNELSEVQAQLLKLAEAKALSASTSAYLKQVIPLRTGNPAFRYQHARTQIALARGLKHAYFFQEALVPEREAIEELRKLVAEHPENADYAMALSQWLMAQGGSLLDAAQFQEADAAFVEACRLAEKLCAAAPKSPEYALHLAVAQNAHAYLVREEGRFADSVDLTRAAIRILAGLESAYPEEPKYWFPLPIYYRNIAQPLGYVSNSEEEQRAKREAARIEAKLAKIPEAARTWTHDADKVLGGPAMPNADRLAKQQEEVESLLKQGDKEPLEPALVPYVQARKATGHGIHAGELSARGLCDEGRKEYRAALDILEKLNAGHPGLLLNRSLEAELRVNYGMSFLVYGQIAEGKKILQGAVVILEKLADENPKTPQFRFRVSEALTRISQVLQAGNEIKDAAQFQAAALDVLSRLAADYPRCSRYRRHQAQGYLSLGKLYYTVNLNAEAEAAIREGVRLWPKVVADFPAVAEFRDLAGSAHGTLGQVLFKEGKYKEAEDAFAAMLKTHQQLLIEHPQHAQYYATISLSFTWIGQLKQKQERGADAVEYYSKAIGALESALKLNPRQRVWLDRLKTTLQARSDVELALGKHADYQNDLKRVRELGDMLESPLIRLVRIEDRVQRGEITLAVKEADDLFGNVELTESQWCDLAAFYEKASAKTMDAAMKETLTARGIAALRHAVELGHARAGLADDPRFRGLVQHAEFRQWMQEK